MLGTEGVLQEIKVGLVEHVVPVHVSPQHFDHGYPAVCLHDSVFLRADEQAPVLIGEIFFRERGIADPEKVPAVIGDVIPRALEVHELGPSAQVEGPEEDIQVFPVYDTAPVEVSFRRERLFCLEYTVAVKVVPHVYPLVSIPVSSVGLEDFHFYEFIYVFAPEVGGDEVFVHVIEIAVPVQVLADDLPHLESAGFLYDDELFVLQDYIFVKRLRGALPRSHVV